jgi:hypothetical protein
MAGPPVMGAAADGTWAGFAQPSARQPMNTLVRATATAGLSMIAMRTHVGVGARRSSKRTV